MNLRNQIYIGANERKSLVDFEEPEEDYKDIILFIHGYKGFKDWGAWNLMQTHFVKQGIAFCKFNMSHNGGTIENPMDFSDLEAFSLNRYTYELKDVQYVLDWLSQQIDISTKNIHLLGHSRGGGIAILSANDSRISTAITLGSISNIENRFPKGKILEEWEAKGVYTVKNSRTLQDMPHKYILYEDWFRNKVQLNIKYKAQTLNKQCLHFHGNKDETVSITESENLCYWTHGKLFIIKGANHTFNSFHPYDQEEMPNKLYEVCNLVINFIGKLELE